MAQVDCPRCLGQGYLYARPAHESPLCDVCGGKGEVIKGYARMYGELAYRGEDFSNVCTQCGRERVTVPAPEFGEVCAQCLDWVALVMRTAAGV